MVNAFVKLFQHYPELAIFLALALGYWIGSLKFRTFSLGAVTGVLIVGVLIGQMHITISPNVKSVFFLMYLFAVGYSVGPQFFRGLKSDGLSQVFFAIIVCLMCLFTTYAVAKVAGFDAGMAAGLLSGACTISAVLGVASDAVRQLNLSPEHQTALINNLPVAYAVTYIFGTAGVAWFLSSVGPKMLGVNLEAECKDMENKMGKGEDAEEPGVMSAYSRFVIRAYRLTNEKLANKTVADFEGYFEGQPIVVERIRQGERLVEPQPPTLLEKDDRLAVASRREDLLRNAEQIGPEVDDKGLLDFPIEMLDVVITNKAFSGKTLGELRAVPEGRGVGLRKLVRTGHEVPFTAGTSIDRGDVLQLVGSKRDVERVASIMGYADRPTNMSDMVFVGAGIVLGGVLGALSVKIGRIPLSLSTSGGALIAGLVFGYLRSVHRTFGRVPAPALWILNSVGLTAFIAVVGISAGPAFVSGLKDAGLLLFLAGVVVTLLPMILGIWIGKYVFKFHPGIVLGACAGARTTTAALGSIQDVAKSKVPALGYTVTYAVGNTLLTIWGIAIILLMA